MCATGSLSAPVIEASSGILVWNSNLRSTQALADYIKWVIEDHGYLPSHKHNFGFYIQETGEAGLPAHTHGIGSYSGTTTIPV